MLTFNLESWKCWHFNLSSVSRQVGPASSLTSHSRRDKKSLWTLLNSDLHHRPRCSQAYLSSGQSVCLILGGFFLLTLLGDRARDESRNSPRQSGDMKWINLKWASIFHFLRHNQANERYQLWSIFRNIFCCTLYVFNMLRWLYVSFRQDFLFP